MDKAYTYHSEDILAHLGEPYANMMTINNNKLEDDNSTADVVIALALIHWIFSCSEGKKQFASNDRNESGII